MSTPNGTDVEMRPSTPALPSDFDSLINAEIESQRLDGFFKYDFLTSGDFTELQNIIICITGSVPINPANYFGFEDAVKAYQAKRFGSLLADQYFKRPPANNEDSLRAFSTKYRGRYPQVFLDAMENYRKKHSMGCVVDLAYSWSIVIAQSSGMGKSRLVHEMSSQVFVIPINLSEQPLDGTNTYPPPDDIARTYFLRYAETKDLEVQARCVIFLAQLFKCTKELLDELQFSAGPELPSQWNNYLKDGESSQRVGQNRLKLLSNVVRRSEERFKMMRHPIKLAKIVREMNAACQSLSDVIEPKWSKNNFFVAFDGAHILMKPRVTTKENRMHDVYSNLTKVLRYLSSYPAFFLFLATSSNFSRPVPLITHHPSAHGREDGHVLFPPWTELPFDMFVKKTLKAHQPLSLDNACSTDVMAGFGRPLWYAHHRRWVKNRDIEQRHIFEMAYSRLRPALEDISPSECDLAAIGVRVGITLARSTPFAVQLESRLVERHMRVAMFAPTNQDFMGTVAPSEPILAEAAGRICRLSECAPPTLRIYFRQGILVRGECEQVVGRLLVTLAHDEVIIYRGPSDIQEPIYHRSILLLDLLKALFNPKHHKKILEARPSGDPTGASLAQIFDEAYVNFSHFALAANDEVLDVKHMYKCLKRGVALQAPIDQGATIDAVIPVHLGPTSEPISEGTTSSINLKFNNHTDAQTWYIDRKIVIPNKKVPTISLVFELGDESGRNEVIVQGLGRTYNKRPSGVRLDKNHYEIVAYGHSSDVFGVIPKDMESIYSDILAAAYTGLVDDYPHSDDPEMVALLRAMKPEFYVDDSE